MLNIQKNQKISFWQMINLNLELNIIRNKNTAKHKLTCLAVLFIVIKKELLFLSIIASL